MSEADVEERSFEYDNPMREPQIEKVVVHSSVGEGGEELIKAENVLEMVTGRTPVRTNAKQTNQELGIREGVPIGCLVTIRDTEEIHELLEDVLWVRNDELFEEMFDDQGNLSFGIPDYTDLPDHKYDPEIGVVGFDINLTIERPGGRVQRRRRRSGSIPDDHRISAEEAMHFMEETFDVEVI